MAKKTTTKKSTSKAGQIYELEIWLIDIEPRIWRRFTVPANIKLPCLHDVIQDVMGWTDSHLHAFTVEDDRYSYPHPGLDMDDDELDERNVKLIDLVLRPKDRFVYEYDFGDGWNHVVEVVKFGPSEAGVKYPVCLAGERACPPEDSGGPWNYEDFLDAILDPDHEEHQEMLDWVGDSFDPEIFDAKEVNRLLRMNRSGIR